MTEHPKKNKCKYCSQPAYRNFCSLECQGKFEDIVGKIQHQKDVERLTRRVYTPEESKNLKKIEGALKNNR